MTEYFYSDFDASWIATSDASLKREQHFLAAIAVDPSILVHGECGLASNGALIRLVTALRRDFVILREVKVCGYIRDRFCPPTPNCGDLIGDAREIHPEPL
jgi:hypothetical protein